MAEDNSMVKDDFKDRLLANLYSTVEFLNIELEDKNYIIRNPESRIQNQIFFVCAKLSRR